MESFIYVLAALYAVVLILKVLYKKSIKSTSIAYCRMFGWHATPRDIVGDGILNTGHCPRCGKQLIQNRKGYWI